MRACGRRLRCAPAAPQRHRSARRFVPMHGGCTSGPQRSPCRSACRRAPASDRLGLPCHAAARESVRPVHRSHSARRRCSASRPAARVRRRRDIPRRGSCRFPALPRNVSGRRHSAVQRPAPAPALPGHPIRAITFAARSPSSPFSAATAMSAGSRESVTDGPPARAGGAGGSAPSSAPGNARAPPGPPRPPGHVAHGAFGSPAPRLGLPGIVAASSATSAPRKSANRCQFTRDVSATRASSVWMGASSPRARSSRRAS